MSWDVCVTMCLHVQGSMYKHVYVCSGIYVQVYVFRHEDVLSSVHRCVSMHMVVSMYRRVYSGMHVCWDLYAGMCIHVCVLKSV